MDDASMAFNQRVLAGHAGSSGAGTGGAIGSGNGFADRLPTPLTDMDLTQQSTGVVQSAPGTKSLKSLFEAVASLGQALQLNQVGGLQPPPTPLAASKLPGLISSRGG